MNARALLLSIHVVTAILGVGPLLATAWIASQAARHERPGDAHYIVALSRFMQWALLVMLLTGLLLLRETGWGYVHFRWLQLSFALFVVIGAVLGMANRPLRRASGPATRAALTRFSRLAWACCALTAIIAVLMVTKPA